MSRLAVHLFTFTGSQIATAARRRAASLAYDQSERDQELKQAKDELGDAIAGAVDFYLASILVGHSPPPLQDGSSLSFSKDAAWGAITPTAKEPGVQFEMPVNEFYKLRRLHSALGDATREYEVLVAAAARYASQHDNSFELDADDVVFLGLDQEGATL